MFIYHKKNADDKKRCVTVFVQAVYTYLYLTFKKILVNFL